MGLFDGLSKFGVKNMDSDKLFEEEKLAEVEKVKAMEKVAKAPEEKDYVFQKSYTCVICDNQFKSLSIKANKAKISHMDKDLRPIFEGVEPLKYEPVCCPRCGYSVMAKYMIPLTQSQRRAILDNISQDFHGLAEDDGETASFDSAIEKYKLALAGAMLKRAKASEKAYICLKGGWLCRAYAESLDSEADNYEELKERLTADEKEFLDHAYEGFMNARANELFPIAGMDQATLDYLIAVLAMDRNENENAAKLVAGILQSASASPKIKERALNLKNELLSKMKK